MIRNNHYKHTIKDRQVKQHLEPTIKRYQHNVKAMYPSVVERESTSRNPAQMPP